jgi:hypothetical protein
MAVVNIIENHKNRMKTEEDFDENSQQWMLCGKWHCKVKPVQA